MKRKTDKKARNKKNLKAKKSNKKLKNVTFCNEAKLWMYF
jgi:hypothetical protein